MLRRNSCRSQQSRRPLSRSKSANSISQNPVHELVSIEPWAAERDAHIAAVVSYYRAQAQRSSDSEAAAGLRESVSTMLARSNSVVGGRDMLSSSGSVSRHNSTTSATGLHRQQSVRFTGPMARPRKRLAARASTNSATTSHGSLVFDDSRHSLDSTGPSSDKYAQRPRPRPLSHSCAEPRSLQYYPYVPEDDIASLPSSYRRLRKSRSMYTPSMQQTPNYFFRDGNTVERASDWPATPQHASFIAKDTMANRALSIRTLRAPKSMSFLRSHHQRSASQLSNEANNGGGIQTSHGRIQPQSEHSAGLKSHSSMFFRSKHKRNSSSTSFPKSLRHSSNNSGALSSVTSAGGYSAPKPPKLRNTARRVSQSLRSKLKGLFGRARSGEYVPEYVQDQPLCNESDADSCLHIQEQAQSLPQEASMSRVLSHIPSFHAASSSQQLKSRQGSVENLVIEETLGTDEKSRVTSWTSSAPDIATQGHLSCQQAYSIGLTKVYTPPSFEVLSTDSRISRSVEGGMRRNRPVCDSQRVYSALMKRLEETKQHEGKSKGQQLSHSPGAHISTPTKNNSATQPSAQRLPRDSSLNTIRFVQHEDDVFQVQNDHSSGRQKHLSENQDGALHFHSTASIPTSSAHHKMPISGVRQPTLQIAKEPPKPLSGRSSAFFASPTCHLFRTTSPYRRALQESMKSSEEQEEPRIPGSYYLGSLSALSLPTRRPSLAGSEKASGATHAESVYSCSSDEKQLKEGQKSPSRVSSDALRESEHGDATIFVNHATHTPKDAVNHRRDISSASSVEWKTWLSANVSKLETPSATLHADVVGDSSEVPRSVRHIREATEIEPDEDYIQIPNHKPDIYETALPFRMKADAETSRPPVTLSTSRGSSFIRRPSPAVNENSPPNAGVRPQEPFNKESSSTRTKGGFSIVPAVVNVHENALSEPRSRNSAALPRIRSLNTLGKSNSNPPMRDELLLKRRSRNRLRMGDAASAKSSPSLSLALEKQFGVTKAGSPGRWQFQSQSSPFSGTPRSHADEVDNVGMRELDPQVMGSKRMVDLFLTNRRKRIEGSVTRQSSDSLSGAFI